MFICEYGSGVKADDLWVKADDPWVKADGLILYEISVFARHTA